MSIMDSKLNNILRNILLASVELIRLLLKNHWSKEDLETIQRVNGYLEKSEWALKTIKDDDNVKIN